MSFTLLLELAHRTLRLCSLLRLLDALTLAETEKKDFVLSPDGCIPFSLGHSQDLNCACVVYVPSGLFTRINIV